MKSLPFRGKRIVLAGGGTGGHISPLLALAAAFQAGGADLFWIGGRIDPAGEAARSKAIPFFGIETGKWRRYFALANLLTPWLVLRGMWQAWAILKKIEPRLIVAKGGYVSLPTVLAGAWCRIPIVIHESDAVMGFANRVAARFAHKICVSYALDQYPATIRAKIITTGVPVRPEFHKLMGRTRLTQDPRAASAKTMDRIFVTGGSQGSQTLNLVIRELLPLVERRYHLTHLTGPLDWPMFETLASATYQPVAAAREEMASLMDEADIVISRAGASTLSELAALGKPAILIPLAADPNGHQAANAKIWETHGAAVVLTQTNLRVARLKQVIDELFRQPDRLARMGQAAHGLATLRATEAVLGVCQAVLEEA